MADMSLIQQSIGVCPQHDMLWDELTAREHMQLHAAFKGIEFGDQLDTAVSIVLDKVGLLQRADTYARDFSGGMKRRLAVAMSAVGDVDAIFLDEPTTGLDPLSRRHIWDMINWLKRKKVVVLTTHNMEEADYLGDNILIMHDGKKKAFGNSLFLKETYGKGYQINLVVDKQFVPKVNDTLRSALPGSRFVGDGEDTGYLSVSVSRRDVVNLPRFFSWLESSPEAAANVREWGISNTTLEQVFLMLSKTSSEINYAGQDDTADSRLCPLCRIRNKETVVVRNVAGQMFILPDSVCTQCTFSNSNFFITDEEFAILQNLPFNSPEFIHQMDSYLSAAHTKSTQTYLEQMRLNAAPVSAVASENVSNLAESASSSQALVRVTEVGSIPEIEMTNIRPKPVDNSQIRALDLVSAPPAAHQKSLVESSVRSQVVAIILKNGRLQYLQRCSNICGTIFVGIMFLLLYVFSLIFVGADSLKTCPGGWVTASDCNEQNLINHLFAETSDVVIPSSDSPTGGALGFAIKWLLIPSYAVEPTVLAEQYYTLPYYENHLNTIWSPFGTNISTDAPILSYEDLFVRSVPNFTENVRTPNEFFLRSQSETLEVAGSSPYPSCRYYAPVSDGELFAPKSSLDIYSVYASRFATAVYDCSGCNLADSTPFFNGTMWLARIDKQSDLYRYAFVSFNASQIADTADHSLLNSPTCPRNMGAASTTPLYTTSDQTITAMTYLNMLSNSMYSPSALSDTLYIQSGVSDFGTLFFDIAFVARIVALFLCICSVLLMNGTWPLSVWRLSYERSAKITLMMKTVGMRPYAYILGMYAFDMLISNFVGMLAMVGAVELGFSRFKDAPLALLILISLLSSHALNGMAVFLVQVFPQRARFVSLFAAVLSICASIASLIIMLTLYPNEVILQHCYHENFTYLFIFFPRANGRMRSRSFLFSLKAAQYFLC